MVDGPTMTCISCPLRHAHTHEIGHRGTPSRTSGWRTSSCTPRSTPAPPGPGRDRHGGHAARCVRPCWLFPSFTPDVIARAPTSILSLLTTPMSVPPLSPDTAAASAEAAGVGAAGLAGAGAGAGPIPQRLLTKYIMYARSNVRPQINDVDQDKIERLLRRPAPRVEAVRRRAHRGAPHRVHHPHVRGPRQDAPPRPRARRRRQRRHLRPMLHSFLQVRASLGEALEVVAKDRGHVLVH